MLALNVSNVTKQFKGKNGQVITADDNITVVLVYIANDNS